MAVVFDIASLDDKFYDDLFLNNVVSWDSNWKINYQFCWHVFDKFHSVYKGHFVNSGQKEVSVMRHIFNSIDNSISFPSDDKFKNFKRKFTLNLKKKDCLDLVKEFYGENEENIIGKHCKEIGISISVFDKIILGQCDSSITDFKGRVVVTNKLALELHKYIKEAQYSFEDLGTVLNFLSGQEKSGDSYNKCLYSRLKYVGDKAALLNAKSLNQRKVIWEMLDKDFFSYLNEDLNESSIQVDFEKKKSIYGKEMCAAENKFAVISQENERLREVYFLEKKLHQESTEKCDNLLEQLGSSELRYQEACSSLNILMERGNELCTNEIKHREELLKKEIEELKVKNCKLNEKQTELIKANREVSLQLKAQSKTTQGLNDKLAKEVIKKRKLQKLKHYYQSKVQKILDGDKTFDYDSQIEELKGEIKSLENEKLMAQEESESFMKNELSTLKNLDGSYKNKVRACFQDLVLFGVGIKQTKKVILSVLKNLANVHVDESDLPSETFARSQYEEARLLAMAQLGNTLSENFDTASNTLQTDGTSKFGRHYGTFDIRDKSGTNMVLGMRPMVGGDSETILENLKEIIAEIEKVCDGSKTNMAKKILASIKNTMSDRHIVQKKFNLLLQEYRCEILPDVIETWENLTEEEKQKMKSLNFFYCALHYVVGLADQAESALKVFDKLLYDETPIGTLAHGGYSKNAESGTLRLIRTLCKAVHTHGCEKSGRSVDFNLSLQEDGIPNNPLAQFKGNRFNIIFYNGGIIYYLEKNCKKFFEQVFDENKLLGAVYYDLKVPSFIAGCKALGLIDKFLTGPLWRLVVKVQNILELNKYYQRLQKLCLEISEDASEFLNGNVIFFPEFEDGLMNKDTVYYRLMEVNEEIDGLVRQILELMFGCFAIITERMLGDHLNGGKFDQPSADLILESKSSPNENVFTESNFGCLDRLLKEKPNANDITLEAIIMCRSNKTQNWRDNLSELEKNKWITWAKKNRSDYHQQFLLRRNNIRKLKNEKRLTKIENKKRKAVQSRKTKEDLCVKIEKFGGLWKNLHDIEFNLSQLKDEREMTEALRCQLRFRQRVLLESDIVDSKLFNFSHNKVFFTNSKLKENLEAIISDVDKVSDDFQTDVVDDTLPILKSVPIEKLDREKGRLKLLLAAESRKGVCSLSTVSEPEAKKRRTQVCDKKSNLPDVATIDHVVGKRVSHLSEDEEGKPKWYTGTVVCKKPGGPDSELVIRYDGYPTLYSIDYSEFGDNLLKLIPLDPEFIVGKFIMHKFCDESESDEWFESGKIIYYNSATGLYTVNYFDDDADYELPADNQDLSVYESLVIDLESDYLNNDIKFL